MDFWGAILTGVYGFVVVLGFIGAAAICAMLAAVIGKLIEIGGGKSDD